MVNLDYVTKRKRRRAALILSGIATIGIVIFMVIAFVGKLIGSFTISIKNSSVNMALATDSKFDDSTTFLDVGKLPSLEVYTAPSLPSDEELDDSSTNGSIGRKTDLDGNVQGLYFFKYTFFLRNGGDATVEYKLDFAITANSKPVDSLYGLDDIIRIRWYDNEATSSDHNYLTYAKVSSSYHVDEITGEVGYEECIASDFSEGCIGYATPFASDSSILTKEVRGFLAGEMRRYTIVMWAEGSDPETSGSKPAKSAMKLEINIEAYEDKGN
jgi:hypothetical protein